MLYIVIIAKYCDKITFGSIYCANSIMLAFSTGRPPDKSSNTGQIIGYSVLGVCILVLTIISLILAFFLMKKRKKSKRLRMRPKSTNLELQGQMPFIPTDSQSKTCNMESLHMEKQYLEKLCSGITIEKGKGERASNHYTEMVFSGDQKEKESVGNGHFLAMKT